jgi:hypothetical protein
LSPATKKPFNLTLIQPAGYSHSLALAEVIEYLQHMVAACGFDARTSVNRLSTDMHNIVFCAHLLNEQQASKLPLDTIIFNSEQLTDREGWHFKSGVYRTLLGQFHIWDYSLANLPLLDRGRTSFIPFHYCAGLRRNAGGTSDNGNLLFYGSISPRRKLMLEALKAAGIPVRVMFGIYGVERDRELFSARAVLNLHKAEADVFEPIRCFYPLINDVPVISEESVDDPTIDAFRPAIFTVLPERFVEGVRDLMNDATTLRMRPPRFRDTDALTQIKEAIEDYLAAPAVS